MFCTECGTKLDDGATFCTNCGHQIPAAAAVTTIAAETVATPVAEPVATPVAEPVATPVAEPVVTPAAAPVATPVAAPAMSQPMYSEPAAQSMYSQPTGQSMYSEPMGQNTTAYGTTQNTYGNNQPMYGNAQNPYGAQNPSYNYNAAPQQPEKKKGKGCLIAALITGGVCLLGLLIIIIAIILGLKGCADNVDDSVGASYSDDYSDADWYVESSDVVLPSESESESVIESESESESIVTSNGTYSIADVTGAWTGTTSLVSVTGADEMQSYLEGLYGRSLTQSEIDGLTNAPATEDYAELYIYDYEGDDGMIYPGSWELDLDMGDFFGDQIWDDWDALTYDEFTYGDRSLGCITLDENNSFYIEVMEKDYLGEYGSQFFDAYDYDVQDYEVEEDGAYGLVFSGQVSEGAYGPQITGEFIVMFQYGDMSEPYGMAYEYTMDYFYAY